MAVDLIATFECVAGERTQVAALISDYARHVNASPGTVRFDVYTQRENPNQFVVIERYADEAAFQAHLADPANDSFNAKLGPLITGDASELTFLTRIS